MTAELADPPQAAGPTADRARRHRPGHQRPPGWRPLCDSHTQPEAPFSLSIVVGFKPAGWEGVEWGTEGAVKLLVVGASSLLAVVVGWRGVVGTSQEPGAHVRSFSLWRTLSIKIQCRE